jgi:hypothetical protein
LVKLRLVRVTPPWAPGRIGWSKGDGSFGSRSILPAALGFHSTLRDGHPSGPIVVVHIGFSRHS